MTGGACGTALPAQTDVILGPNTYSIDATELKSTGYSYSICYSCDIKPTGLPLINFTKDSIKVTALPLDCSTSLADANFENPQAISYTAGGSGIVVISGYTDIFIHTK